MFDLHAHVLPGIDDGPADEAAAVEFVRAVAAEGTTVMVATPHLRHDHPRVKPEELASRVARLEWALARASVDFDLTVGGEVDLVWALEAGDDSLRLVSYGQQGTDLLLETPYGELPGTFERLVAQLAARGYRIVLAHPERNPTYQQQPRRLLELVGHGVLLQVTASALVADRRSARSRVLAEALIREGIAHLIASDGHGAHIARAGLGAGASAAERLVPGSGAWYVEDAPAAILRGEPLPPRPARRRSGRWRRRV
jgi:protein-tyrosine phosphatase